MLLLAAWSPLPVNLLSLALQVNQPSAWADLFWLTVIFLVMLALNRWITYHVNGIGLLISANSMVATWLYFILFLPGILVHEVSHYVVALAIRADPTRLRLWPEVKGGRVVLGAVEIRNSDPFKHSLVGVAPLVMGSLVVWLVAQRLQFDRLGTSLMIGNMDFVFRAISESLSTPDFWLWLYFLFAVGNVMLPSPADRTYWTPILAFLGTILLLLLFFDLIPEIPRYFQEIFLSIISALVFALTTVVVVDLVFIVLIYLVESILGVTTGRRVKY